MPPWRLQGPPALPETPPPFYVHFISYYYTRALAPVSRSLPPPPLLLLLSLCPPFLSPPSRLFRNISPLALARRATSSLILPTRSLNNDADPRNLRRRNRLCGVLVISVFGMEPRYFALRPLTRWPLTRENCGTGEL